MKVVSTLSKKTNHCISPKYQTAALEELSLSVAPMQPFHSSTLIWLPALHKMDLLHCGYFDVSWQERCINGSYIPLSGGPASVCAASLSLLLGTLVSLFIMVFITVNSAYVFPAVTRQNVCCATSLLSPDSRQMFFVQTNLFFSFRFIIS